MSGEGLFKAAKDGDLAQVRQHLNRGVGPDSYNSNGTALGWACNKGHTDIVIALLAAGAKVGSVDNGGGTPLHDAAYNNRVPAARALLSAGADVSVGDKNGDTPLHLASYNGSLDVARVLVEHPGGHAVLSVRNNDGRTPLEEAKHENKTAVVDYLTLMQAPYTEIQRLENELQRQQTETERIKASSRKELSESEQKAKTQLQSKEVEVARLTGQLESGNKEKKDMELKLSQLQVQLGTMAEKNKNNEEKAKAKEGALESKIQVQQAELEKMKKSHEAETADHSKRWKKEKEELEDKVTKLEDQLQLEEEKAMNRATPPDVSSSIAQEYEKLMSVQWQEAKRAMESVQTPASDQDQMRALAAILMECFQVADELYNSYTIKRTMLLMEPLEVADAVEGSDTDKLALLLSAKESRRSETLSVPEHDRSAVTADSEAVGQSLGAMAASIKIQPKADTEAGDGSSFEQHLEESMVALQTLLQAQSQGISIAPLVQETQKRLRRRQETQQVLTKDLLSHEAVSAFLCSCCRLVWRMLIHQPPLHFMCHGVSRRYNSATQVLHPACRDSPLNMVEFYVMPQLYREEQLMVKGIVFLRDIRK